MSKAKELTRKGKPLRISTGVESIYVIKFWQDSQPVTNLHKILYNIPTHIKKAEFVVKNGEFIWRRVD